MDTIHSLPELKKEGGSVMHVGTAKASSSSSSSSGLHVMKPPPPAYPPPPGKAAVTSTSTTAKSSSSSSSTEVVSSSSSANEISREEYDSLFTVFYESSSGTNKTSSILPPPPTSSSSAAPSTINKSASASSYASKGLLSAEVSKLDVGLKSNLHITPSWDFHKDSIDKNYNIDKSDDNISMTIIFPFCEGNQFVGLITALILVKGWNQARYLLNLLETYGIDPLNLMKYSKDLKHSLAGLMAWYMDGLYSQQKLNFRRGSSNSNNVGSNSGKGNSSNIINDINNILFPLSNASILSKKTLISKTTFNNSSSNSSSFKNKQSNNDDNNYSSMASYDNENNIFDLKSLIHIIDLMPTTSIQQLQQVSKTSYQHFPTNILSLLTYFGYHCKDYIDLFSRICRLLKEYIPKYINKSIHDAITPAITTNATTVSTTEAVGSSTATFSSTTVESYGSSSMGISTGSSNSSSSSSSSTIANDNYFGDNELLSDEDTIDVISTILYNVLLPALSSHTSISGNNPYLSSLIWSILSLLPFNIRFSIYDYWHGGGISKDGLGYKHNEVVLAETIALHSARSELKRLAKENTKIVGRKLSKYTETCPLVVFNYILTQVEAFDNLIPFMVDSLKFSTDLAKDVMAYSLISQLKKGSSSDAKLKKGDTHFSQWFSSLTKFIGTFYCRYPTTELKGLLHYILYRLSIGDSLDLLVLKELLVIMGSSITLLEVSLTQLDGLSGGKALQNEVFGQGNSSINVGKGLKYDNKAVIILRDELMNSKTAIPLLLFIAQIRSRILFDQNLKQIKLISHLYDTSQDVLMQFTSFLVAGSKSLETIANQMPDFAILLEEVGLSVPVAFQLVRPLLRAALQQGKII